MIFQLNPNELANGLVENGYIIVDQAISTNLALQLNQTARDLQSTGNMRRANTGQVSTEINSELRGDFTYWIEANASNIDKNSHSYLQCMESLRTSLNQTLFLGLADFETHYAIYPAGKGYSKHLDQFQQNNQTQTNQGLRKISSVLYLNQDWKTQDGGQLRLYINTQDFIDIAPITGRLVLFLSDRFWHEVLPAKRDRISLTGWFRTRKIL